MHYRAKRYFNTWVMQNILSADVFKSYSNNIEKVPTNQNNTSACLSLILNYLNYSKVDSILYNYETCVIIINCWCSRSSPFTPSKYLSYVLFTGTWLHNARLGFLLTSRTTSSAVPWLRIVAISDTGLNSTPATGAASAPSMPAAPPTVNWLPKNVVHIYESVI